MADTQSFSTTAATSVDDRPIFVLVFSLGGAGAVLIVSTLFLCCYIYRMRVRRRNYPLGNRGRRSICFESTVTNDGTSGTVTSCSRSRSPVTTEAEIYGFDTTDNVRQRPNGVDTHSQFLEPSESVERKSSKGFDNPVYKKFSEISCALDSPVVSSDRVSENNGARRCSSPTSAILPGLPSMLVVDDNASDDRRRLVPNDHLSLEIDRSQRLLRSCLEMQREIYEKEESCRSKEDPLKNDTESNSSDKVDLVDAEPKPESVHPASRRKLHRRLAKTIAKDRVLESSVTFTCDLGSPPSPVSASAWANGNGDLQTECKNGKNARDSDDLEVIFKERTLL